MSNNTPVRRFDLSAGKPYTTRSGEDKKQWIRVGRMTEWSDGNFSLEIDSTPAGNWFDGRVMAFPEKEREHQGQRSAPKREAPPQQASDFNDDLPDF